jgi:hypothetical protein
VWWTRDSAHLRHRLLARHIQHRSQRILILILILILQILILLVIVCRALGRGGRGALRR